MVLVFVLAVAFWLSGLDVLAAGMRILFGACVLLATPSVAFSVGLRLHHRKYNYCNDLKSDLQYVLIHNPLIHNSEVFRFQ